MKNIKDNSGNLKLVGIISSCFFSGFVGGALLYLNRQSNRQGISLVDLSKENYSKRKEDMYETGRNQYISLKKVTDDVRKDAESNAKDEVASAK